MKGTSTTRPPQGATEFPVKTSCLRDIALVMSLCSILLFWRLGDLPFYSRGEPREGLVVKEMNASGNWILPRVNGEYIPSKPPLFHWLALLCSAAFGRIDEFTLRLPSALLAAAGALLIYAAGRALWGGRAGLVAATALATTAEWWQAGTDTQVDMTLAFFITAANLYFYFLYRRREFGFLPSLGLALLLGLAALAKGPVGIAVPCLAIFIFLVLRRDLGFIKKLHPLVGAAVILLTAGSWYAAALWQGGPAFFFRQIVDENFRTAAGTYGHHQPVYYYLPILLANSLPWSLFFPPLALFLYSQRRRLAERDLSFLLVWFFVGLIFFSASLGKRGVYILPLYPALALLFGAWWQELENTQALGGPAARWIGFLIAASCLLALTLLFFYFARVHGTVDRSPLAFSAGWKNFSRILRFLAPPSPLVVGVLLAHAAAAVSLLWALSQRRWQSTFASLSLLAVTAGLIMKLAIFPPIVFERTMKPFMSRVNQIVDPSLSLLFYRGFDYGAVFYADRHVPSYEVKAEALRPPFYLLMWEEDWRRLSTRSDLQLIDLSEGLGPAGRHRLALVEYRASSTPSPRPLPVGESENPAGNGRD